MSLIIKTLLARLHGVHITIVVISVVRVHVPIQVALRLSFSIQLLTIGHSYLNHRFPVRLSFIPWNLNPGSILEARAIGRNIVHR